MYVDSCRQKGGAALRSWSTKKWLGIVTLLVVSCIIFGCGRTRKSETTADNSEVESFATEHSDKDVESESEETKSEIIVFQSVPSNHKVSEFLELLKEPPENDFDFEDECFNITPEEISVKYGFDIFKYNMSFTTYLMVGDEICKLGSGDGGYGPVSFAIADLNQDGQIELYFTYSWGSGIHWSNIAYYDFATKEITELVYVKFMDNESIFQVEDDRLMIYLATVDLQSRIKPNMEPTTKIGEIVLDHNQIKINQSVFPEGYEEENGQ